jgi:flagellar basal-body rod modification protein FlgD
MSTVQTNQVSTSLLNSMNGTTSTATSSTQEAQDRFMTLLVTQMKNQDPLNPLDNAQVTSQLAQLSTVTGIDKLNTTVESLISNVQSSQALQATNMIGHNVLVTGSTTALSNGAGLFGIDLPASATNVTVTIRDSAGNAVRTMGLGAVEAGTYPLQWDGKNDQGVAAADGTYKIEVSAKSAEQTVAATTLSMSQVAGVSNSTQGVQLKLSDATSINLSDIKQIL